MYILKLLTWVHEETLPRPLVPMCLSDQIRFLVVGHLMAIFSQIIFNSDQRLQRRF